MLICWEVIVPVILSKNIYVNMFPILNSFWDTVIWLYCGLAWVRSIAVPGGKVNILGGYSIGHSKQEYLYEHLTYTERFLG